MRVTTSRSKQAGDTIVEVILAVAIVSSVLTGAFVVTNRSSKAIRDSEEHAQALQFLQGQVEQLRSAAVFPGRVPTIPNVAYCFKDGIVYPANNTNCTLNQLYHLSFVTPTGNPGPPDTTTFNFAATWSSITGSNAEVDLFYKVQVAP